MALGIGYGAASDDAPVALNCKRWLDIVVDLDAWLTLRWALPLSSASHLNSSRKHLIPASIRADSESFLIFLSVLLFPLGEKSACLPS